MTIGVVREEAVTVHVGHVARGFERDLSLLCQFDQSSERTGAHLGVKMVEPVLQLVQLRGGSHLVV